MGRPPSETRFPKHLSPIASGRLEHGSCAAYGG